MEKWIDISGFPGYQASSEGRIRGFRDFHGNISNDATIIKPRINKDGYYELTLYTENHKKVTKRVHRLVAETFLGEHPGLVVNHIDGCKLNNRINNLEFISAQLNSTLAAESGLYKTKKIRIVETGEVFNSVRECAKAINVHPFDVSHYMGGARNSIKGFTFEYVEEQTSRSFLRDSNGCHSSHV